MKRMTSAALLVSALAGTAANAQVLIGNDQAAANLWEIFPAGGPDRLLAPGRAWGMAYDSTRGIIYFNDGSALFRAFYTPSGTLTVEPIGTIRVAGSIVTMTGLAFDTVADRLYGFRSVTQVGFFEINTTTAEAVLARSLTSVDFGGFDFDPATNAFYAVNDGTATGGSAPGGRGIYRIDRPIETGAITKIGDYPAGDTDIDGLAVGNGRLYLVNDVGSQGIPVFNIAGGVYEPTLPSPFGTGGIFSSGAYVGVFVPPTGTDLAIRGLTDPADCAIALGGTADFSFTARNNGPDASTAATVTFTFPPSALGSIESTPAGTVVGDTLTITLPGLAGGEGVPIGVSGTVLNDSGPIAISVAISGPETDPTPANNTAGGSFTPSPTPPATAAAVGLISTITGASTSDVPGIEGAKFSTGAMIGRPYFSADQSRFVLTADTDLPTASDAVLLRGVAGGAIEVVAREGFTELPTAQGAEPNPPPYFVFTFDAIQSVNDAGDFAFSGIDNRAGSTNDGFLAKSIGGTISVVAQELITVPPASTGAAFFGGTRHSASITNAGTTGFFHNLSGAPTGRGNAIFRGDTAEVLVQSGVTVPAGQFDDSTFPINTFAAGTTGLVVWFNADHSRFIYSGALGGGAPTASDTVVVVDGTVRIQEGFALPNQPALPTVSSVTGTRMTASGDWLARGAFAGGQDYVVKNGELLAITGQAITDGAGEFYSDTPFAATFFMMLANPRGDVVIGGTTDAANDRANAVLVLNDDTVILRENDPVDVDGDGAFDDGLYVRTFIDDRAHLTNDGLYVVVRLRDANAALCGGPDTDVGQALIRVALPATCPCAADYDGSGGTPDGGDIDAFFADWIIGDSAADVDCSGGTPDGGDIDLFFSQWIAGGCD